MMYFAGRPELQLPPAPDTPRLRALRITAFVLWLLTTLLFALWLGTLYVYDPSSWTLLYIRLLAIALSYAIAQGLHSVYFLHREAYEKGYWTPERVRQHCPSLWYLYCAGNALPAPPAGRRNETPR
jgi:hypothetical protein